MRSHYQQNVWVGKEHRPLDVALLEDERYAIISSYATQVESYLSVFGPERMLVVCQEDLLAVDRLVLASICRHIGLDPALLPDGLPARVHVTAHDHPLPRERRFGLRRR